MPSSFYPHLLTFTLFSDGEQSNFFMKANDTFFENNYTISKLSKLQESLTTRSTQEEILVSIQFKCKLNALISQRLKYISGWFEFQNNLSLFYSYLPPSHLLRSFLMLQSLKIIKTKIRKEDKFCYYSLQLLVTLLCLKNKHEGKVKKKRKCKGLFIFLETS